MKKCLTLFILILNLSLTTQAQKVGVVLSGGGARGLAHIGVLKALEENHIPIDYITGTSIGAMIGGMYAMGYTPDEIAKQAATEEFIKNGQGVINPKLTYYFKKKENNAGWITIKYSPKNGWQTSLPVNLIDPVPMDYSLMEHTAFASAQAAYNFDSLIVPFRCVAADIDTKQPLIFSSGDLGQAIRASYAFPFYYPPVNLDGKILYDGGLYNNFPIDVMMDAFHPDYIIGVDVSSDSSNVKDEDNLISQIRTMIVRREAIAMPEEKGILIRPQTDAGLWEFERTADIVQAGYRAAMDHIQEILHANPAKADTAKLTSRRLRFRSGETEMMVSGVEIQGLTKGQAVYIKRLLMPDGKPIDMHTMKVRYFRLIADDNIRKIYPKLRFDRTSKTYILELAIKSDNAIKAQFGGNFASRPINEGYFGLQKNLWGSKSLNLSGNAYFGKLYSSGMLKARIDFPGKIPYYLEPLVIRNGWDFFKSSSTFFEDIKPSYLVQSDLQYTLNAGIPIGNKGKLNGGVSMVTLRSDYYQSSQFFKTDTTDITRFDGESFNLQYERNSLNRKLYASAGSLFSLKARYNLGQEIYTPGSTALVKNPNAAFHEWYNVRLTFDDYFKQRGNVRFGLYSEINVSNQPFFSNYTSTILAAPAFQPVLETKTLFLESFHAHNFAAIGTKTILTWKNNIDLRLEGYMFQPYQEIRKDEASLKPSYGDPFARRYFMASAGAVLHSPVGPLSLTVNYFHNKDIVFEKSLSLMFHFGYILFNNGALD